MLSYRVDEQKVVTQLFSFSERTIEHLKEELGGVARNVLAREIRASWSPHRKSGRMDSSLRVQVKQYGGRGRAASVWAYVLAGGTKRASHAHLFERGFQGVEQVPAHDRTSRLGIKFPVKAYQRQVVYPAHEYMRRALEGNTTAVRSAVERAVGGAIDEAGLGS